MPRLSQEAPADSDGLGRLFPLALHDATLNAPYVDFAVRGPGEETILELLAALRGARKFGEIRGLSWKNDFGFHVHNADRPLRSPNDFPGSLIIGL